VDTTQILKIQKELAQRALEEPESRHKRLYRLVCDAGWLRAGLDAVLSNKGSSTPGIDGVTKATIDARKDGRDRLVQELQEELLDWDYRPQPVKRVYIPKVNGKDMSELSNRIAYLDAFGARCMRIGEVEAAGKPPSGPGDLLVVLGHDTMDRDGHGNAQSLVRRVQLEVDRLARLVRKLHGWEYETVHVVTDHGFILLDEARLPEEVQKLRRRFAALSSGWEVRPSTRILELPGVGLCVPDLRFSKEGVKPIYLEVMGFWSRDAVWRRVDLVRGGLDERVIFAVSSRLRVSEEVLDGDLPGILLVYKGSIPARRVLELLESMG